MEPLQPLKRKLPLLISALLFVVVTAVCWTAYRRVESALIRAADARIVGVTRELEVSLARAARRIRRDARVLAADSAVVRFLAEPSAATRRAAEQALERARVASRPIVSIALWSRERVELLAVGAAPASDGADAARVRAAPDSATFGIGPLMRTAGGIVYRIVAPVRGARGDTLGMLVEERGFPAGNQPQLLGVLIGSGAAVRLGNAAGDVWTDLLKEVEGPPARLPIGTPTEFVGADGVPLIGMQLPVRATPWVVVAHLPRRTALAPARRLLVDLGLIALVFVALGAAGAWALSRQVTAPLVEVTRAAEDIARGDYARRVSTTRRDELGRLASAFNSMAEQVGSAAASLTARADELEAANAKLRDSEQRYRQLVELSPDGIIVHRDLRIRFANPAALVLVGAAAPADFIGRSVLDMTHPDEHEAVERRTRRCQEAGEPAPFVERRIRRLDGTELSAEAASRPIMLDGRRAVLTIIRDTSERKRLEAQFRQAQKMEAVGQLAGGVAHDFNNVLTVIAGYTGILLADLPADAPARADVAEIQAAAERAATLTRQLLAFSRRQLLQPRPLDLNALTADLEKMLRRVLPADIQFETRLDPALGSVHADPGQIEQVLMNLVVNARDAMPDGGRLTIETANVELAEGQAPLHWEARPGHYVMLAVSDTGHGMDEDVQAHIFEPFFTTKEKGKGTGLGLSTAYGIVKQSGGFISVYSEPGHGTVFKVYLPRVDAEALPDSRADLTGAVTRGCETILLAEDEAPVRATVRRILERAGYTVLEAATGREALELCARGTPAIDLLVTDMVMPDMNGRDLAARFRERYPRAATLFMSGYTEDDVQRQGVLGAGVVFVEKPFTPQALTAKVREALAAAAPAGGG
ncbi:MAG: PAS domain S-box protein [Gemmatimonadetes bacterium]|nr:PAS domain S-box protein [Gemmatimonadota bacterium]